MKMDRFVVVEITIQVSKLADYLGDQKITVYKSNIEWWNDEFTCPYLYNERLYSSDLVSMILRILNLVHLMILATWNICKTFES